MNQKISSGPPLREAPESADLPAFDPQPVTLDGIHVRLEPLSLEHVDALWAIAQVETMWRYLMRAPKSVDDLRGYVEWQIARRERGEALPFATVHKADDCVAGSTVFHDFHREHRGLEIGWTWIGIDYQRTVVNTEAKYLQLAHAFETLGAIRVQIKTDSRNVQSQKAIERIGGRKEGVLRNHMILWDGHYRDTTMYSVTRKEWPEVKSQLRMRLL